MGKSFSRTAAQVKESAGGAFAAGEYVLQIIDTKLGAFKSAANSGLPKVEVQFKVVESGTGEGLNRKVRDFNVPLEPNWKTGKNNFNFDQFWIAAGVIPEGGGDFEIPETDEELQDLWETEVKAVIAIDDNGYNTIKRYLPPSRDIKITGEDGNSEAAGEFAL